MINFQNWRKKWSSAWKRSKTRKMLEMYSWKSNMADTVYYNLDNYVSEKR